MKIKLIGLVLLLALTIVLVILLMPDKRSGQFNARRNGYPKLVAGTNYQNLQLKYQMLGYEVENSRFWVIIDPILLEKQNQMNNILTDIYEKYSDEFNLDKVSWNVSFFANKDEAGYKTFKPQSYLAEYWSKNSYDEDNRNKIIIYPAYPEWQKWYYGPQKLSVDKITVLLTRANKKKYAEAYKEAKELYEKVLALDPNNQEALQGKDDCQIMLEPFHLVQALAPPPADFADPDYQALVKQQAEARTPWDKRRAEIAFNRFALKYTEKIFGEDQARLKQEVDKMIKEALQRIRDGESAENVYQATKENLIALQEKAHRSWKGHGPQFLDSALKKLDDNLEGVK